MNIGEKVVDEDFLDDVVNSYARIGLGIPVIVTLTAGMLIVSALQLLLEWSAV